MAETIGIRLNQLIEGIVPFYFSEAQTKDYPYAVYSLTSTPIYTKDGIHHYDASVQIDIYSESLEEADSISKEILNALDRGMKNSEYYARLSSMTKECMENVWDVNLNFTCKQNSNGWI